MQTGPEFVATGAAGAPAFPIEYGPEELEQVFADVVTTNV